MFSHTRGISHEPSIPRPSARRILAHGRLRHQSARDDRSVDPAPRPQARRSGRHIRLLLRPAHQPRPAPPRVFLARLRTGRGFRLRGAQEPVQLRRLLRPHRQHLFRQGAAAVGAVVAGPGHPARRGVGAQGALLRSVPPGDRTGRLCQCGGDAGLASADARRLRPLHPRVGCLRLYPRADRKLGKHRRGLHLCHLSGHQCRHLRSRQPCFSQLHLRRGAGPPGTGADPDPRREPESAHPAYRLAGAADGHGGGQARCRLHHLFQIGAARGGRGGVGRLGSRRLFPVLRDHHRAELSRHVLRSQHAHRRRARRRFRHEPLHGRGLGHRAGHRAGCHGRGRETGRAAAGQGAGRRPGRTRRHHVAFALERSYTKEQILEAFARH